MYGVNMWDRVLMVEEIIIMFINCIFGVGNFLRWSDFIFGLYGNVKLILLVFCEFDVIECFYFILNSNLGLFKINMK